MALGVMIFFLIYQKMWLVYFAVVLLTIPLISKKVAFILAKGWFAFSEYLGAVMNYIIIFICFYFFLVPLSFLQKMFGKNQILKKPQGDTYFHKRKHLFTADDIDKPW